MATAALGIEETTLGATGLDLELRLSEHPERPMVIATVR
jgi:hypothetical protein